MLDKLITEKTLENLAGAGSFQRGNAYFFAGSVGPLRDTGKKVSARVDLVAAYLQRRRNDEALQLTWVQFEERPSLEHYKKLHTVAEPLGVWPEQRERALARVAEVIADQAAFTLPWQSKPAPPDYSLRLEIALWENDLDAAWTAVHAGNCNQGLLIALAGQLEPTRPNDAVRLIGKAGEIMNSQKRNREFDDYIAELRARFKAKRNFIKLLNEVGKPA
jgi:hypothetical protein